MRKLKIFQAVKVGLSSSFFLPLKIFFYKRSKWGAVQKKIKRLKIFRRRKKRNLSLKFVFKRCGKKLVLRFKKKRAQCEHRRISRLYNTNLYKKIHTRGWSRRKGLSVLSFRSKTYLHFLFKGAFSLAFYRQALAPTNKKIQIYSTFIKPEYRVDLLLYRLFFFSSPQGAECAIRARGVLINSRVCRINHFVTKGDVIQIKRFLLAHVNANVLKFCIPHRFLSFFAVDYFCCSVIILYKWSELKYALLPGELKSNLSLQSLRHYFFT